MSAGSSSESSDQLRSQYAEIAAMAGGLAHEIRNPLSTISLNMELLVEELAEGESARDQRILRKVRIVQRECDRLAQLLEEFLRFSRAGELDLETVNLNTLLVEFIDFFRVEAEAGRVELSPHLAADLPLVRVDRDLFRQVLINLARNAREAMPSGGVIEFLTGVREGRVEMTLIDNGLGMTPEVLAKVFSVFFSTKPNGSGLGLPTVRRIIEAHGGLIRLESEPGRGTRVTVSLPAG